MNLPLSTAFTVSLRFWVEKVMAPHSSTLAWKIPWAEEPGRLQSMESQRVRHDWAPSLSFFTFMHWRRKWQPTPVFLPGESQRRQNLGSAIYRVTQNQTRLKWLSSSSSIGFGLLCFHFYSFLCIFWFLSWFLLWFIGYSEACCLAACVCIFKSFFSCNWHLILLHCAQKRCLKWFQFFKIYPS